MKPMTNKHEDTKISKITILTSLWTLYLSVSISSFGTESATYNDFLTLARENNPGVQAAYNRWQAELSKVDAVGALPDPKLTYGYFIESVETRTGPQEQKAGISQQLPWFGKLDAKQQAQLARADSTYEQYRSALLQLAFDVRRTYTEGWHLHREIELTRQHIQLLENIEGVAESRVRAGASASEVIKTQLELAQLRERLQTLDEKRIPIHAELNAALNRDSKSPIAPITELDGRSFNRSGVEFPSLESNPGLIALRHGEAGAVADIRAAKKSGLPDITFGVEWIGIGDAAAPVNDSGKDAWMAGIGINLPLWRGTYSADVEGANYMRQAFSHAHRQKANTLRTELESALASYRAADRKITLYHDTILPQAGHLLELSETDYRSGTTGFLDLIDTQRSILRYQLELARAQADRQIQLARIEMLTGKELTDEK